MKISALLIISLSLLLTAHTSTATTTGYTKDKLPSYSQVYDDQRDPFKDAVSALALAKETNRRVLIEIGGNWCSWCKKMDAFLDKNKEVFHALHSQYVVLKVNVSDSNENADFMKTLPPVLGYPHMYVSAASGKMLLSKDTAELLDGENYSKSQWLTFLDKWAVSTTLAQGPLITATKDEVN